MSKAVFIDRDHTILKGENLKDIGKPGPNITKPDQVIFLPKVLDALRRLSETDYKIIVVTNQADVGRGKIKEEELDAINLKMENDIVSGGGRVDSVYCCKHKPEDGCSCRKPGKGLFERAKKDFSIEKWEDCWMIGDSSRHMAVDLPMRKILVKTGYGGKDARYEFGSPDYVAEDLLGAVGFIVDSC